MVIVESYKDLLGEIEILEWLKDDLVRQLQRNEREVWGHSMPLTKSLARYDNIMERMEKIEEEISEKMLLKKKIDDRLNQLDGVAYTIAFKRDVEGKSLKVIAFEMGHSYGYIMNLSSRIAKNAKVPDEISKM